MKKMGNFIAVAMAVIMFTMTTGCTKIESGHAGIRVGWNGVYDPTELGVGWHQTMIGDVKRVVASEITIEIKDQKPQTKDKTLMHDMDLSFNYAVTSDYIVELATDFKGRDLIIDDEVYPMGLYVQSIVITAMNDVVGRYDALDANDNREKIRAEIMEQTVKLLKEEKLDKKVEVKQIFVKNMQISPALTDSALVSIAAQNELKAKIIQVQVADQENRRLSMMSGNAKNMEYMALENQRLFIQKMDGKSTIYVIPTNLTSFMVNK